MIDHQILGYVLGALDAPEMSDFERRMQFDPDLARRVSQMQQRFATLEDDRLPLTPPAGLAERTCQAAWGPTLRLFAREEAGGKVGTRRWRLADVLVAVAVSLCGILMLFPAVSNSRYLARRLACQNNLQQLGQALWSFADYHGGSFPTIPDQSDAAVAGSYVLQLADQGFVTDASTFCCPNQGDGINEFPRLTEIRMHDTERLTLQTDWMKIVYGYQLQLGGPQQAAQLPNRRRPYFAIMADPPRWDPLTREVWISSNHGGWGQNVLFESGVVRFIRGNTYLRDHLFKNDQNEIGPSLHDRDAVIVVGTVGPDSIPWPRSGLTNRVR